MRPKTSKGESRLLSGETGSWKWVWDGVEARGSSLGLFPGLEGGRQMSRSGVWLGQGEAWVRGWGLGFPKAGVICLQKEVWEKDSEQG